MESKEDVTKMLNISMEGLPTISVCMIIKDEEAHLSNILPRLVGAVEEIIILDTGSTDKSVEIAESFGIKVYHFEWIDDFSAARNEAHNHATMDYIFWLDGDDMIERQDLARLKLHLKNNPDTAVFMKLVDKRPDKILESKQLRVYPNHKDLKWVNPIHEQIAPAIEAKGIKYSVIDMAVVHVGYYDPAELRNKLERNFNSLLKLSVTDPDNYWLNLTAARTALALGRVAIAEKFSDKTLELLANGAKPGRENEMATYLTKATILGTKNKHKETLRLLKSAAYKFPGDETYGYTIGEVCFRLKNYAEAMRYLLPIRGKRLPVNIYPTDRMSQYKSLFFMFLACSLALGDKGNVTYCAREITGDPTFTVATKWK